MLLSKSLVVSGLTKMCHNLKQRLYKLVLYNTHYKQNKIFVSDFSVTKSKQKKYFY